MRMVFVPQGGERPLDLAKAGHADAYKRPPFSENGELAAAVTLKTRQMIHGMASSLRRSTLDLQQLSFDISAFPER